MNSFWNSTAVASSMEHRRVRWGDTVRVDFMTWLEDGTLFDSSVYSEPLIFTAGTHSVMQAIEDLVIGMAVGESRTERIPPGLASGSYRSELCCRVRRGWLEEQDIVPHVGLGLELRRTDDTLVRMVVTGVDGDCVTLDANHRMAGRHFMVQLDLLEILNRPEAGFVSACA